MPSQSQHKNFGLKHIALRLGALLTVLILVLFTLRIFVTTQSGARFIESQINQRHFGSIEHVRISGLSGDPLDDFALKSVKIYDKDGLWLSAEDIKIDWSPWSLRRNLLNLQAVTVKSAEIIRQPTLNSHQKASDAPFKVKLETGSVEALTLNETLIGQTAIMSLSARLTTKEDGIINAELEARRTDKLGDTFHIDFNRNVSGDIQGDFKFFGAENGPIANFLRAPQGVDLDGSGQINGSESAGQGNVVINFDGSPKITAKGQWTDVAATIQSKLNTTNWPLFDTTRRGLGDTVDVTMSLDREISPMDINVELTSNQLYAKASGKLNSDGSIVKAADILIKSDDLGAILPLADGFNLGAGEITGAAKRENGYAFTGDVHLNTLRSPYGEATTVKGPFSVRQNSENQYYLEGNWAVKDLHLKTDTPIKLSTTTSINARAVLDTHTAQIDDISTRLVSGNNILNLTGIANYEEQSFDLSGSLSFTLEPAGIMPSSQIQSDYRLRKKPRTLPSLSAEGAFRLNDPLSKPYNQLLGSGVNFDIDMSPIKEGVQITNAKLSGKNLRAALSGKVTNELNIQGEVLLSAPFAYAPIALDGETNASFTLTGARENPNLRLEARTETLLIREHALNAARLRMELTDILKAPKGPLRLTADTGKGALDFTADLASQDKIYVANQINLKWGSMSVSGNISKPLSAPVTGQLSLNLPEQGDEFAKATLVLSAKGLEQGIDFNADAKNIAYKSFAFDYFNADARGTLSALTGQLNAKGQRQLKVLERQFSLEAPFSISQTSNAAYQATSSPYAKYGNIVLDAESRINATYDDGDITLAAPLTVSGSSLDINYERLSDRETLSIEALDQPVTLIPMPGNLADTRGRIASDIVLTTSEVSGEIVGGGTISLQDWRGFDVPRGDGLSGNIHLDIDGTHLNWTLKTQSSSGFKANSAGYLPIKQASSLSALRPDMDASLTGQFSASGSASTLLSLITPSDANPGGEINANLTLSGTASTPLIEGQINGAELRMEAPQLGTRLRDGRFTAHFTNDTLNVRDVYLSDNDAGILTGQGNFTLGEFAKPIGTLEMKAQNFLALDRKDFKGRVSGDLNLEGTQEDTRLTGDVTFERAEVKQFVTGGAAVVEIPVEEINKPKTLKAVEIKAPATPIDLNVRVRAPRRIFVRSRGLDVELALDATLKGTLTAPEIYGDATVLRGGYKIAGKELAFESGGIKFDGDLGQARVNLIAQTNTQNLSAVVTIKGTVSKPEIKLSSTPERPQDEILSALLFGRSATELSTIEAAQLAGALAQFSGAGGGFDLMGGLRDALGISQLSIGIGQDGAAQITGGRYLAKNVYLQVFSGGATTQTGAVIDWEIRKNLSLRSQVQADNEQNFSLKWKRDF